MSIKTGQVLEEDSIDYHGPIARCDGGGDDGGGGGFDYSDSDTPDWGTTFATTEGGWISTTSTGELIGGIDIATGESFGPEGGGGTETYDSGNINPAFMGPVGPMWSAINQAVEAGTHDEFGNLLGDRADAARAQFTELESIKADMFAAEAEGQEQLDTETQFSEADLESIEGTDYADLFEGGVIGQEVLDTSAEVQAGIDSGSAQEQGIFEEDPLSPFAAIDALVEQPDIVPDVTEEQRAEGEADAEARGATFFDFTKEQELFEGGVIGQEVLDTTEQVQAGIDAAMTPTESINEKALQAIKDTKLTLSPLALLANYAKEAAKVELTPAEQAIYDADIAASNVQFGGDDTQLGDTDTTLGGAAPILGDGDGLGGTDTDPATSGETERRGDEGAGPVEGEGETPEEIEEKARQRKGFAQNLFTGALGLGKANARRRYLLRGGGRQR